MSATVPDRPPAPNWLPVIPEGLPPELREGRRFVVWRAEWRGDRWTKMPYKPADPARKAAATRPEEWGTFAQALAVVRAGRADGLGRTQDGTDDLIAIDLDHVLDDAGQLAPWAAEVVRDVASYTERSPSDHGLRLYVRGALPFDGRRKGSVEVYRAKHYMTLTGQHVPGTPRTVEMRQAALDRLIARYLPDPPAADAPRAPGAPLGLGDQALLERARRAANGDRFAQLYDRGDWAGAGFSSQSEADLALCGMLAFWFGRDVEAVDRAFRGSALVREKWLEREDYRTTTITKAVVGCREVYQGNGHGPAPVAAGPRGEAERGRREAEVPEAEAVPAPAIDPKAPLAVARAYLADRVNGEALRDLHYWQGDFYAWTETHYQVLSSDAFRAAVYPWLDRTTHYLTGEPIKPNRALVEEVMAGVKAAAHVSVTELAAWLDGADEQTDPRELLACRNGLLHVPTRTLRPPTRAFFTVNALPCAYVPDAPPPELWLAFLHSLWGDDAESIAALQEWFGLWLTLETRYQKALMLLGPRRSGKGTIARIAGALVGAGNVVAPTLQSLGQPFGLESMINTSLAIVSDARLGGRADLAAIAETILRVTGEDVVSVPRKHRTDWTGRLRTRFLVLSNELPAFLDASGALASRFVVLRLTGSFAGREDLTLADRLLVELPGILRWALVGLERLRAHGRVVQPASAAALVQQFERLASPVAAFLEERCVLRPGASIECGELYHAWKAWCQEQGRAHPGSLPMFGKDLGAACPGVRVIRPRIDGARERHYAGLRLRNAMDPDDV